MSAWWSMQTVFSAAREILNILTAVRQRGRQIIDCCHSMYKSCYTEKVKRGWKRENWARFSQDDPNTPTLVCSRFLTQRSGRKCRMPQLWWRCNSQIDREKQWTGETIQVWQMWDPMPLRWPGLTCQTENKGAERKCQTEQKGRGEGSEPKKGPEERWNKCVRFETVSRECFKGNAPPSFPPSTLHTTKYTHAERHSQHSTKLASSESRWIGKGGQETGWARRNQAGCMLQQQREHVLTAPYIAFTLLDNLRTGEPNSPHNPVK